MISDLPFDLKLLPLSSGNEEFEFSFQVKKQALGPHIRQRWEWDEEFQRGVHAQRLKEKPFFRIMRFDQPIGTLSLQQQPDHLRFGEFYLADSFRGRGIGSQVLVSCLKFSDEINLPVRLEYLLWNPVGSLYRRHGFVEIGRTSTHFLMERQNVTVPPES